MSFSLVGFSIKGFSIKGFVHVIGRAGDRPALVLVVLSGSKMAYPGVTKLNLFGYVEIETGNY